MVKNLKKKMHCMFKLSLLWLLLDILSVFVMIQITYLNLVKSIIFNINIIYPFNGTQL